MTAGELPAAVEASGRVRPASTLLEVARSKGIQLHPRGDVLHVAAPPGRLSPDLRRELIDQKPALLALLAGPERVVRLRGGLCVPLAPLAFLLDLEIRGIALQVDADHQLIEPPMDDERVTASDREGFIRWHRHLAALLTYQPPADEVLRRD